MAITTAPGRFPHIMWIDLHQDGTLIECAVMRTDDFGQIYYIQLDKLDAIDKHRLVKIIRNRNAQNFALWDLMSNITLGNGMNALKYFHQLVKVITPEGKIFKPSPGRQGIQLVDTAPKHVPTVDELEQAEQIVENAQDAGVVAKKKRGGRPAGSKNKPKVA